MESEPWYNVIDRLLPERSKEMTRQQGVVYLKRCIITPAFQQLAWFFALYDGYKIITEVKNVDTQKVAKYYPAASVEVYHLGKLIFQYKVSYVLDPEDSDSTLLKLQGKVHPCVIEYLMEENICYQKRYEQYNGFVHPYPTILNGEKCTAVDLLDDFAKQFHLAMGGCWDR